MYNTGNPYYEHSNNTYNQMNSAHCMQKQGDRRLWNKSNANDLDLEYPDYKVSPKSRQTATSSNRSSNQATNYQNKSIESVTKRYEEHLFHLHLNNQLSKLCAKKDKETEQKEKLEGGFSLYVNGAHKKEKPMPRHTISREPNTLEKRLKRFNMRLTPEILNNLNNFEVSESDMAQKSENAASSSNPTTSRRKWNDNLSSIVIKTNDGVKIRLAKPQDDSTAATCASSSSNDTNTSESHCFYSYDFESDDDDDGVVYELDDSIVQNERVNEALLIEDVNFTDDSDADDDNDVDKSQIVESENEISDENESTIKSNESKQPFNSNNKT